MQFKLKQNIRSLIIITYKHTILYRIEFVHFEGLRIE